MISLTLRAFQKLVPVSLTSRLTLPVLAWRVSLAAAGHEVLQNAIQVLGTQTLQTCHLRLRFGDQTSAFREEDGSRKAVFAS